MRRQDAGFVWGGLDPFGRMPGMVFAQPAKGIPYQPYLYLQASFDKALKYAAVLVVIGYSWRDTYLNEKILSASVDGLNVINVGREARKIEGIRLSLGGGVLAALEGKRVFLEDGSAVEGGLRGAIIKHFPELTQHVNPGRCCGRTEKDGPCSRQAKVGSIFCGEHEIRAWAGGLP
jgi:hypothetical protein